MYCKTESYVKDELRNILELENPATKTSGVGQEITFKQLGFDDKSATFLKPDGWYFPNNINDVAIICEAKSGDKEIEKHFDQLKKYINIVLTKYKKVIGIIYNGYECAVFKNNELYSKTDELKNKEYYLSLFNENKIDKQKIYNLTKNINTSLHFNFGINNLYHRMIFTACALVAERYGGQLTKLKDMDYATFHTSIHSTFSKSLNDSKQQNQKVGLLLEVYSEIKMNITDNQKAINNFIDYVVDISKSINSDYWNGEDVMAIFFNEFNRYKNKSETGQVFTPDHITSLMYRLIEVNKNDVVFDGACGSGAFLVKSMCNMIKEAGGVNTTKAKQIKQSQLYGIEIDREIFALACANMLIHKDGKTNLEQLDTRTENACNWIKSKPITKVLMNPPFENKYGCMQIVENVLNSVSNDILCAFILPDKKLEKCSIKQKERILKNHKLKKIIKLPENIFPAGTPPTSIFIFEAHKPQNDSEIFTCYIEEDGLETMKNQGRQDIKNKWQSIEDYWVNVIEKQSGDKTIKWIKPNEFLSYQTEKKEFELYEEDFIKTVFDYYMFENSINQKEFNENLLQKILYSSKIVKNQNKITIDIDNKKIGK